MLVGFSPADEWAHQDLFLKDYRMGCPYGGKDGGIQRWNVHVLYPKKLFDSDGNLGEAGKYLKLKLKDALTNFDNVRIDHVLGLVDPFIYSKNGYRQGNINDMPDIDPDKNYQKVLDKIILPTLKEYGIDKYSPVWEDLVTETPVFVDIYYGKNGLSGITPLEYKKGEHLKDSNNWALVGSHDSDPAHVMVKKDWIRANEAWDPRYLAGVLNAASDSREYCKKIASDDNERVKAKFAELFMMGDKVQISFADFFGIDKTYNQGGNDENPNNWKLRLNKDYEDTYYENLASENPTAINMPEILKLALQGEAEMKIAKGEQPEKVWSETDKILFALDKYAQILKE
jgi:4-alpha-glucanotransferase